MSPVLEGKKLLMSLKYKVKIGHHAISGRSQCQESASFCIEPQEGVVDKGAGEVPYCIAHQHIRGIVLFGLHPSPGGTGSYAVKGEVRESFLGWRQR